VHREKSSLFVHLCVLNTVICKSWLDGRPNLRMTPKSCAVIIQYTTYKNKTSTLFYHRLQCCIAFLVVVFYAEKFKYLTRTCTSIRIIYATDSKTGQTGAYRIRFLPAELIKEDVWVGGCPENLLLELDKTSAVADQIARRHRRTCPCRSCFCRHACRR